MTQRQGHSIMLSDAHLENTFLIIAGAGFISIGCIYIPEGEGKGDRFLDSFLAEGQSFEGDC